MKILKKNYKLIIVALIIIVIFILGLFIYKNIFKENSSNRLENIEKYKLTKKEINSVNDKINELKNIDSIDVYTNNKIIKIFVELKEDVDFEDVEEVSNELLESFKEDNLKFYDVEIFIDSQNDDSKVYPKIGYKHKTNSEFTWNR